MSLQWSGVDNKEISETKISKENIKKVELIEVYRDHFNEYFKTEFTDVYSETVMLKDKAVTYLVYASPVYEIKAKENWFPFFGSFPYLGFFNLDHAKEYEKEMKEQKYVTYMRPVYAYSTLGWFDDSILSSFFVYDKYSLAELIFHEMTHLEFFINSEVSLNENLAQFVSREMAKDYFQKDKGYQDFLERGVRGKRIRKEIVRLVNNLKSQYKMNPKNNAGNVFSTFMKNTFNPEIKRLCTNEKMADCYLLRQKWSNARFLEFETYEKDQNLFEKLYRIKKFSPKSFINFLVKEYDKYDHDNQGSESFQDYLNKRVN